ncbi:MAG: hypothetical protein AAFU64_02665 [Bacteroidota bacterium]
MKKLGLLFLCLLLLEPILAQKKETTLPRKWAQVPSDKSIQFISELGLASLAGLGANPSFNFQTGVYLPKARFSILVGGNTPTDLNRLGRRSLFENGENLDIRWQGEVGILARYHFSKSSFSGFSASLRLGYEGFELSAPNNDQAETITTQNLFLSPGLGYTLFVFGPKLYLSPYISYVWLLGNDAGVIDQIPFELQPGFLNLQVALGIKL